LKLVGSVKDDAPAVSQVIDFQQATVTAASGSPYAAGNDPQGVAVWPKGSSTGGH
jgi:hypothetical protein